MSDLDLPEGLVEIDPRDSYLPTSWERLMLENGPQYGAPMNPNPPEWALRMVEQWGREYAAFRNRVAAK